MEDNESKNRRTMNPRRRNWRRRKQRSMMNGRRRNQRRGGIRGEEDLEDNELEEEKL